MRLRGLGLGTYQNVGHGGIGIRSLSSGRLLDLEGPHIQVSIGQPFECGPASSGAFGHRAVTFAFIVRVVRFCCLLPSTLWAT